MSRNFLRPKKSLAWPLDVLREYLGDIVYGASDGIVTTFTVVGGVAGAHLSTLVLVILGIVNLIADGFSMGAASYLSNRASAEARGEEDGYLDPFLHGLATFCAFVIFGTVPLLAYLIPSLIQHRFLISCIMTGVTLILVGVLRALVTQKYWLRSSLEMFFVGMIAAAVAYGVGALLGSWLK